MRAALGLTLLLLASCASFQKSYRESFDKSFLEKCQAAATEKGATPARAKAFCTCTLAKVNSGVPADKAASDCQ